LSRKKYIIHKEGLITGMGPKNGYWRTIPTQAAVNHLLRCVPTKAGFDIQISIKFILEV